MRNNRVLDREEAMLDEILREKVRASMANKKPSIPAEVVFQRLEARHARQVKTQMKTQVKTAKRDASRSLESGVSFPLASWKAKL